MERKKKRKLYNFFFSFPFILFSKMYIKKYENEKDDIKIKISNFALGGLRDS